MDDDLELHVKYNELVKDNEELRSWIDKLSEFLLINYYHTSIDDIDQWSEAKKKVVRDICL